MHIAKLIALQHALQKAERESSKLKDRLIRHVAIVLIVAIRIVNEKSSKQLMHGDMINANLPKTKSSLGDELILQKLVSAYEQHNQEVRYENAKLRESLLFLNSEVDKIRHLVHHDSPISTQQVHSFCCLTWIVAW